MRISTNQQEFIHNYWTEKNPNNEVYLFGSRADDNKKGGDIDILILSDNKIHHKDIYTMKFDFCNTFGKQKIDVINIEKTNESAFKKHILSNAILI